MARIRALLRRIERAGNKDSPVSLGNPDVSLGKRDSISGTASPERGYSQAVEQQIKSIRNQVFISYSHKDRKWMERLQTFLTPYVEQGLFSVWADTQIKAGTKWRADLKKALELTKVAVLLVTPHFLASDFISKHELPPLLEAARNEGVALLWIAISSSSYKMTEISEYQAVNDPALPLDKLTPSRRNAELVRICEQIWSRMREGSH